MVSGLESSEVARNNADPLEVKLAGEVQKLLLPKGSPLCSWCCMAARSRMANVLGGDFYDFIELEDGCQILFIGDVTGHGLHASVVMTLVYGFIHRAAQMASRRLGEARGQPDQIAGHKSSGRLLRTSRFSGGFVPVC